MQFSFLQQGVSQNTKIMYNSALGVIFGVKKYADELLKVIDRKNIQVNFKRSLVEVDPVNRQAIFEVLEENRTETFPVSAKMVVTMTVHFPGISDSNHSLV